MGMCVSFTNGEQKNCEQFLQMKPKSRAEFCNFVYVVSIRQRINDRIQNMLAPNCVKLSQQLSRVPSPAHLCSA